MQNNLPRREFLKISALAATLPLVSQLPACAQAARPGEDTSGLTLYELGPQIWIRFNNRPLACYRVPPLTKVPLYVSADRASQWPVTD